MGIFSPATGMKSNLRSGVRENKIGKPDRRLDEIQETQLKMVECEFESFAAVIALWTLVTLPIKLIRMLLK